MFYVYYKNGKVIAMGGDKRDFGHDDVVEFDSHDEAIASMPEIGESKKRSEKRKKIAANAALISQSAYAVKYAEALRWKGGDHDKDNYLYIINEAEDEGISVGAYVRRIIRRAKIAAKKERKRRIEKRLIGSL